ncbi:GrpB family protein [Caldifermentibacillus hisashii]|uniref:GrpB family protein n=1 Tax=Caldifermentibacillus hisashii TaxID=996558 RepID=UPI0030D676C3|nr:GrpB family protein [Caldibacillus thermoamylovorans]
MSYTETNDRFDSTNDEKLREVVVGELKPHNVQITLLDYDPKWPELFEREAKRIYSILGDKVLQLEHVGSTSVQGLCAKPIIDMLLIVKDSTDESAYVPDLENSRYVLRIRETNWYEHRLFKGPDTDINLHVFSRGCPEIERMLRFRDWLKNNRDDRDKYARVKRDLAKQQWKYVQDYADAKSAIVQEIMERANTFYENKE